MEPNLFSSEHIQDKGFTINSAHPSSEDQFERNFQDKISPSNQILKKQGEESIDFNGEQ